MWAGPEKPAIELAARKTGNFGEDTGGVYQ
jgi:hypothetical protein